MAKYSLWVPKLFR